jgi:hypothetical protein
VNWVTIGTQRLKSKFLLAFLVVAPMCVNSGAQTQERFSDVDYAAATTVAQNDSTDGPTLDFTMNYIKQKLESSFSYFDTDQKRASTVEIDQSGNVSIRWRSPRLEKAPDGSGGAVNVWHNQLVEFNVRDMSNDGIDTSFGESVKLECANKLFCVQETLYDNRRHKTPNEVYFWTEDYKSVMHAFKRYQELLGGSRVVADPFK